MATYSFQKWRRNANTFHSLNTSRNTTKSARVQSKKLETKTNEKSQKSQRTQVGKKIFNQSKVQVIGKGRKSKNQQKVEDQNEVKYKRDTNETGVKIILQRAIFEEIDSNERRASEMSYRGIPLNDERPEGVSVPDKIRLFFFNPVNLEKAEKRLQDFLLRATRVPMSKTNKICFKCSNEQD